MKFGEDEGAVGVNSNEFDGWDAEPEDVWGDADDKGLGGEGDEDAV